MALVRDNCLLPTKDAPELGFIRETSKEQFVPDVFYKEKDEFGNEVTKPARPLPIEYLLVDVPASTPVEPRYTFNPITTKNPFPVANRPLEGHVQDLSAVDQYLKQFSSEIQLQGFSDFHLLFYLYTCDLLPRDQMLPLLQAVRRKDRVLCNNWMSQSEFWTSLQSLLEHQGGEFLAWEELFVMVFISIFHHRFLDAFFLYSIQQCRLELRVLYL
jgi:nuclear protein localization family protein 4